MEKQTTTEAVEICPFCEEENSYPNWSCEKDGYVATCHKCGEKIMLCDECLHADDNLGQKCDWHEENRNGKRCGICFRGVTVYTSGGAHDPRKEYDYE